MGLVIQAPLDPVLAPVASVNAGPTGDAAKAPNGFAAIVQAILADGKGAAKKDAKDSLLEAMAQALPGADGSGDTDATTGANAVAAAIAAMQSLTPEVLTTSPGATDAGQSADVVAAVDPGATLPAQAGTPPPVAVANAAAAAQPGSPSDTVAPTAPVSAEDVAALAQPPDMTEASAAEAPAPVVTPSTATVQQPAEPASTPAASLSAAAAVAAAQDIVSGKTAGSEMRPNESRKRDTVDTAASSPGDPPPPAPQDATSVVRFVGNAQSNQGNAEDSHSSEKKNEPNASVQGIAHAAANSAVGQLRESASSDVAPADVPLSTPVTPAGLPPAVERISQTVIEQIAKGGGEARIHLHPAELGEVVVRVSTDGDHVRVEIHAARAEAMNLLRDHTADLSNLLGGRGLNLSDVFVGLGGEAASDGRDQQSATTPNRPLDSEFAALMGIDESPATDLHNRLRAAYNPDGALSYRI